MNCISVAYLQKSVLNFAELYYGATLRAYYAECHFFEELDNMTHSSVRRMLIRSLLEDFMKGRLECLQLDASNYLSQKTRFDNTLTISKNVQNLFLFLKPEPNLGYTPVLAYTRLTPDTFPSFFYVC